MLSAPDFLEAHDIGVPDFYLSDVHSNTRSTLQLPHDLPSQLTAFMHQHYPRASTPRSRSHTPTHLHHDHVPVSTLNVGVWSTVHRGASVQEIWAQKPFRSRPHALAG